MMLRNGSKCPGWMNNMVQYRDDDKLALPRVCETKQKGIMLGELKLVKLIL